MTDPNKPKKKKKNKNGIPPLNKPEQPFYIDKDGKEYSKKQYYSDFGTDKYTRTVIDNHMSGNSNNSKKRSLFKKK
tara:strand:+ start:5411 stop:5638 length:228 start_codon:yes stop_codon:yes gene_type:complete